MRFFVSTGLGMEESLQREISEVWPWLLALDGRAHGEVLPEFQMEKGGLEFEAPLHLGLQLNFLLRTAHRVLLRLATFRCRDFPKLFQQAEKIHWRDWLEGSDIELEVAASQSRLNNEKRIRETLIDAWKLKAQPSEQAEKIYIRAHDDQFDISLDTTGEHLHFRGQKKWTGEAPVRETLAAFCLQQMTADVSWAELRQIELVDPMMGSGTFLLEAIAASEPLSRNFAFQKWKKCPKALTLPDFQRPWRKGPMPWKALRGFDRDPKAIQIAKQNLRELTVSEIDVEDVFSMNKHEAPARRWLVLNPPYGERLVWNHTPSELLEALIQKWDPEQIGVLWSEAQAHLAPKSVAHLRRVMSFPLQNGGLRVQFQIWK